MTRSIALLGSTGSIGRQTLEVARELGLSVAALTANKSVELIEQQAREFCPRLAVLYDEDAARELRARLSDTNTQVLSGMEGLLAAATADSIITATCSDWGCYGLMAALAYLLRNIDILHTEEMEAEVMRTAARSGMIDMTGSLLPGIDGFNLKMNVSILSLMRQCTDYALRYSHNSDRWFGPVLAKHFFE